MLNDSIGFEAYPETTTGELPSISFTEEKTESHDIGLAFDSITLEPGLSSPTEEGDKSSPAAVNPPGSDQAQGDGKSDEVVRTFTVAEILLQAKIEQQWNSLRQDLTDMHKDVRLLGKEWKASIDAQLMDLSGITTSDLFSPVGSISARQMLELSLPSRYSTTPAAENGSHFDPESIPFIFKWVYSLIRFKREHPVTFFSLMGIALLIVIIRSSIKNRSGLGGPALRHSRRKRKHAAG